MDPARWTALLESRGVDARIIDLVRDVAASRAVEPPTTGTTQLLLAVEPDGYAAGRFAKSVLSLFLDPERARRIGEQHGLGTGTRNTDAIVRVPAARLDDPDFRELTVSLLNEALDRVAHQGSWNRGLPDMRKARGEICPVHFVQKSVTGVCPDCEG
ncbi:hypothetical protein L2K70_18805 [Nocardioides KLBMP 9356]|uniref:DUF222 domain-containing protein n=1 Tax=Nocardioides potassii TaxID=2911371 RepID=A0ABS9HH31_9ACTN|nr:hypothetical protein [Nocardioides potassii]MCF6379666.1 hypothetical protein [Nocardioides potassii]